MIKIDQFTKLSYILFIFGLFFIHINAQDQNESTRTESVESNWKLDFTAALDKFHLSFAQKIFHTLGIKSDKPEHRSGPTTAQKYGYGFLSVFIISTFSLVGALVFPLTKKPYYKYINAFFTSVAVGALFSNSCFELFPAIIQFERSSNRTHPSDDEDEPIVPRFLWQMLAIVLTAYVFYVLELMINVIVTYRTRRNKKMYELDPDGVSSEAGNIIPEPARERSTTILSATYPHYSLTPNEKPAVGWMIIIGDGIHNVADGLAIGAAFAENIVFGISQSIAIACQEFPSELGEMMILIESGFTIRRALLFNFFSACTAFLGFFIGVSISENEGARTWIFAIAAGTFTYIALVDLWPKLMPEEEDFDWIRFACVSVGYLLGVFIMFGLGIITEQLVQHPSKG